MLAQKANVTKYDFTERSPKKDKRWSFRSLFHRKKKQECCNKSSSEEDKKKKSNSKRKKNAVGFDHVVLRPPSTSSSSHSRNAVYLNGFRNHNDSFLSDPNGFNNNFIPASNFTTKYVPLKGLEDSLSRQNGPNKISGSPNNAGINGCGRRKKEVIKARAEARRGHSMCGEDSSDEDSQRSIFRSDESLGSLNKKSRTARTQRYLKRRSRDEEIFEQMRSCKSDAEQEFYGRLVKSEFSGLSTIPPSHIRYKNRNSSASVNDSTNDKDSNCRRSSSYGGLENGKTKNKQQAPAPPPRDPKKIYYQQNNCEYRPNSYSFENGSEQSLNNGNHRANSEDHIILEQNQRLCVVPRSASTISDTNKGLQKSKIEEPLSNGYCYFADKSPRSRKPISIQSQSQKPFEFWKEKDDEQRPLMFTAKTHVRTTAFLPNGVTVQTNSANFNQEDDIDECENRNKIVHSPFRPISPQEQNKPSNFEDALDELEAIYNSLHLGDEDLLERAELREMEAAQKRKNGALSDSSCTHNLNLTRRKKKIECDLKTDDMAFRKLNRDRFNTISDPQTVTSSYLLTSPVFNNREGKKSKKTSKEPDVTLDDVAYRSVKHNIDTLKIDDPQLPFGIPIGPITPASNSDYLHATPENSYRSIFKPKKNPDVVKDDLAYRNLRKDPYRDPVLPQVSLSPEDYKMNYNNKSGCGLVLRKKSPTRSQSANFYKTKNYWADIDDIGGANSRKFKEKEASKAFMSDGELKYKKFEDSKAAINELLSSLDVETREADEQIAKELQICDEEKRHKQTLADSLSSLQSKEILLKELEKDAVLTSLKAANKIADTITSEHAKLCEKLLECVATKVEPLEEIAHMDIEPLSSETLANVVLTTIGDERLKENFGLIPAEIFSESEHDYVNIQSASEDEAKIEDIQDVDNEVQELLRAVNDEAGDDVSVGISVSPLERHKAELLAVFEELRLPDDMEIQRRDKVKNQKISEIGEEKQSRSRRQRSRSCGALLNYQTREKTMSEVQGTRAERIARYKEERRKQLASQYATFSSEPSQGLPASPKRRPVHHKETSSSSEEPRTTRASRLRAAASAHDASNSAHTTKIDKEKSTTSCGGDTTRSTNKLERDKSSKRKSNLNRALNSEEIPQLDTADDVISRRRRRRFFPPEILQQTIAKNPSLSNDENSKSDNNLTASSITTSSSTAAMQMQQPPPSHSPLTARISISTTTTTPTTPTRKSELSIHMENARKGHLISYSDMGKYSRVSPKKTIIISNKEKTSKHSSTPELDNNSNSLSDSSNSLKLANKENIKSNIKTPTKQEKNKLPILDNNDQPAVKQRRSSNVSRRMDELTALTHETLAKVERLASRNRDSPKRDILRVSPSHIRSKPLSTHEGLSNTSSTNSRIDVKLETKADTRVPLICDSGKIQTHSILKKKSIDESFSDMVPTIVHSPPISAPVSILKRKVSQDEFRLQGGTSSTSTPPVTFSPSVIDHSSTNRKKQGILKKRRSLDEAQVLRHRSCSPEGALNGRTDSRSILKNQRRSSLEEIVRAQSPESGLHGILKRRTSRHEDEVDPPINSPEPHGILKRKSGTSSAGSNVNSPHVSIATAVILAAAGGAEIILEPNEPVKPILKKKSFSDDQPSGDSAINEVPKPILKKKSSTDTEDCEERPKKPILKHTKSLLDEESLETIHHHHVSSYNKYESSECEVRPILKQTSSRENSPRPRLSFYADDDEEKTSSGFSSFRRPKGGLRHRHTICGTDFNVANTSSLDDEGSENSRPLSVCDMVLNIEKRLSTGAIPKKTNTKRHSERYKTQPVTYHELEASLSSVHHNASFQQELPTPTFPLCNSILTSTNDQNAHSLLDLTSFETESSLNSLLSFSLPNTTFDNGISGKMSSDSAFQSLGDGLELENEDKPTTPTPSPSPSKMEPARFQMKALAEEARNLQLKKSGVKLRNRKDADSEGSISSRFSTQPITLNEVEKAAKLKKEAQDTDNSETDSSKDTERKGILKSKSGLGQPNTNSPLMSPKFVDNLKSVLKKHDSMLSTKIVNRSPKGLRSILKPETVEFARDEGISSDESDSGSETDNGAKSVGSDKDVKTDCLPISAKLARIYSDKFKTDSSEDTTQTSDGESSGGREVRSIIGGGSALKKRLREKYNNNEGLILKSKSQSTVRDEDGEIQVGVRRSMTQATMPKSIAELQAKLQKSGDNEWKKRIPKLNNANEELSLLSVKNIYNEELSEKPSILAARKDELDAASKQWKNRVEQSDALNFSVAGRMQQTNDVPTIPIHLPKPDKNKKTPKKVFKGREGGDANLDRISSTPSSPEKSISMTAGLGVKRSISLPGAGDNETATTPDTDSSVKAASSRKVVVERPDNITFTSFFESVNSKRILDVPDLSTDDFDCITRSSDLLVQKRTVKVQRKHEASRNPIKALAARTDIKDEYTEIITGVAEREKHRLNVEKLAKSSNFAVEALAGLASKEDFSSVALKRSASLNSTFPPYQDLMLLQVKGRRFVQTRLVEPIVSSINEGDNYILVTPTTVFNYIGTYANVIEQSRAADIVNSIQQTGDMGCKTDRIVTINSKKIGGCAANDLDRFWKLLGSIKGDEIVAAGHPDEDEIYESSILGTNMIYEYTNQHLLPVDSYWGGIPKIEMLGPLKIFVFDFGSEMYVWSGKNASLDDKKKALKLARELWNEGYNYTECGVSPIGISSVLGMRQDNVTVLKEAVRPKWALFARITQHRETILFKEKFLDWPDYSKVIKVKRDDQDKNVDVKFDFKPCDIKKMQMRNYAEPDLIVDGVHLGRGTTYFDEETNRLFNFTTKSVTCWVILEYSHEQLLDSSVGQFHDGNSYIIRWEYTAIITGRELSGKPSKYVQAGRDHCVYFCWQGNNATINEKGAAALLTVKLDSENARQIRVLQGYESPAFLSLFKGGMVIHSGKREKSINTSKSKLYICRGELSSESFLTEVPSSMRSLRSRSCFVLINCKCNKIMVWNGCKASSQCKKVTKKVAEKIISCQPEEFGFTKKISNEIKIDVVEEGFESSEFLSALGGEKRQLYLSLIKNAEQFNSTPRLYYLTSLSGNFEAAEVLCPHRNENVTPYPFLQCDLYSASQPALFMLDNEHEVWLWQGWWPEREDDITLVDQTGSGAVRWQEERKAAMQTVVNYCKKESGEKSVPTYLVWAGLEPLAFTSLFPFWKDRDDVAEINMKEGKKAGEAIPLEKELTLLTRSTYPIEQLLQRPLPDGVDPTHLENYLSPEDFSELMSMSLEEFQKLPAWKQTAVKKEKGLF